MLWRFITGPLLTAAIIVIGITLYLAPNDIMRCDKTPSISGDCRSVDAIVAVSGGDTSARTAEAVRLYKNGWAEYLILSGAAADKSGPSNAAAMKKQAVAMGVSINKIIIDEYSENTYENAKNTGTLFKQHDISSVILVTSGYHQRRAMLEFERRSPDVVVKSAPVAKDNQWSGLWWLTPRGWFLAIGELGRIAGFYLGLS